MRPKVKYKRKTYLRWVPAYLPAYLTSDHYMVDEWFQLWNKNSDFYYPYGLFSAGLWAGETMDRVSDETFMMVDSGGFQYGTKNGEKIDPLKVLEIEQKYGDVGFILDNPPWKYDRNYDQEWFERCLRITKSNGDLMSENVTNENFELYGVIQGNSLSNIRRWHDEITKDHEYIGFGVSYNDRRTPEGYVRMVKYLAENGVKENIHHLGLLSDKLMPIIAYANYVYGFGDRITFDSATNSGRMADIRMANQKFLRRLSRGKTEFNLPFCSCPICQAVEEKGVTIETIYIYIHNIYQRIMEFDFINSICNEREDIEKMIPDKFIHWLDVIDGYKVLPEENKNSLYSF